MRIIKGTIIVVFNILTIIGLTDGFGFGTDAPISHDSKLLRDLSRISSNRVFRLGSQLSHYDWIMQPHYDYTNTQHLDSAIALLAKCTHLNQICIIRQNPTTMQLDTIIISDNNYLSPDL